MCGFIENVFKKKSNNQIGRPNAKTLLLKEIYYTSV